MKCLKKCFCSKKQSNPEEQVVENSKDQFCSSKSDLRISVIKKRHTTAGLYKLATMQHSSVDKDNSNHANKQHWDNKDVLRCMFCGGSKCKHEDWKNHKNPAIDGLNVDLVEEGLYASQRPSTILIYKYDLISSFKEHNIRMIVNLQREGEHPYCGPNKKLETISGFSYDPQIFISNDIQVRLAGWEDMSIPDSVAFVLDIVKDMAVVIKENNQKALVHCHAGYGRTGVVVVCYILFTTNCSVKEAVDQIRKPRPKCIQNPTQYKFCERFKSYLDRARTVFTSNQKSLGVFLKNQNDCLFGSDFQKYMQTPKLISFIFEKSVELKGKVRLNEIYGQICLINAWTEQQEVILIYLKEKINIHEWNTLNETEDIEIMFQLLYDWCEDCVEFVVNPSVLAYLIRNDDQSLDKRLERVIKHFNDYSKEDRDILVDELKSQFKSSEFYTILDLASFASEIYPDNNDYMKEYSEVLERICCALLGYNYSEFFENDEEIEDNAFTKEIKTFVRTLKLIIDLMLIRKKIDQSEDSSLTKLKYSTIKQSKITPINFERNTIDNLSNNDNMLEKLLKASTLKNEYLSDLSILNNMNSISNEDQEKVMYDLYKLLDSKFRCSNRLPQSHSINSEISDNFSCLSKIDSFNSHNLKSLQKSNSVLNSPEFKPLGENGIIVNDDKINTMKIIEENEENEEHEFKANIVKALDNMKRESAENTNKISKDLDFFKNYSMNKLSQMSFGLKESHLLSIEKCHEQNPVKKSSEEIQLKSKQSIESSSIDSEKIRKSNKNSIQNCSKNSIEIINSVASSYFKNKAQTPVEKNLPDGAFVRNMQKHKQRTQKALKHNFNDLVRKTSHQIETIIDEKSEEENFYAQLLRNTVLIKDSKAIQLKIKEDLEANLK